MERKTLAFLTPFVAIPALALGMWVLSNLNPDEYTYIGKNFLYIGESSGYRVVVPVAETGEMVPCKVIDYYNKSGLIVVVQVSTENCGDIIESYTGIRGKYDFLKPGSTYYWHLVGPKIIGPCLDEGCKSPLVPH